MKKNKAFTLIETLVYIALFSMFITGAVVSSYELTESSQVNDTAADIEIEGQFLESKIQYDLAHNITVASITSDGNITLSGLTLDQETRNNVSYTNISFMLSTRAPTGRIINQNFSDVYFAQ